MGRPHYKLKPQEETVAKAPDLWYPDGNPDKQKSDTTFYEALDFPILRESILGRTLPESRFSRKDKWDSGYNPYADTQQYFDLIFQDGHFDAKLANYRLDIMQHLRTDPQARQTLEHLFDGLAHLVNLKSSGREENEVVRFLRKGKVYCELIEGYSPFSASAPEGLKRVNQHVEAVQASAAYRKLEEIITKTKDGFHLQMTWRCNGFLKENSFLEEPFGGKSVVSAAILPLRPDVNEFGSNFDLTHYNRGGSFDSRKPVNDIVARAIELKFKRHFANAQEQVRQTLKLFPQVAIYLADLKYMEEQEKRGVHYTRPIFLPREEGRASLINVHHPLVAERSRSVGNPIEYDKASSITVITGPNKGGKSVYVKAVGIAFGRGLKGFFVPAEVAEFSERDGIYTHFIRPEDITKGESRFSDEMRRMGNIFSHATPHSLALLDEPCGGTTLSAGETKTQEFLEVFGELGCPVFITTHMEGIAKKVSEEKIPKARNKHLAFSKANGSINYLYTLAEGQAEMDYGAQIADSLGLSANNLRELLKKRSEKEGFKLGQ